MLSIIIPCHNEQQRIGATLKRLIVFLKKNSSKLGAWNRHEIILVDDSSDSTIEIARKTCSKLGEKISVTHFKQRRGKGFAIKAGIARSRGDVLLYDADGSTPPKEILKLKKAFEEGADVAIGSRFLPGASARGQPLRRRIAGRGFNLLCRILLGISFLDTQCGFKAVRKKVAKKLASLTQSRGYSWDLEMLLHALEKGFIVKEVAIEWQHTPKGNIGAWPVQTTLELAGELLRFKLAKKPARATKA